MNGGDQASEKLKSYQKQFYLCQQHINRIDKISNEHVEYLNTLQTDQGEDDQGETSYIAVPAFSGSNYSYTDCNTMLHDFDEYITPIESLLSINADVIRKNAERVYSAKLNKFVLQACKSVNLSRRAETFAFSVETASEASEFKDIQLNSFEAGRSTPLNTTITGILEESEKQGKYYIVKISQAFIFQLLFESFKELPAAMHS